MRQIDQISKRRPAWHAVSQAYATLHSLWPLIKKYGRDSDLYLLKSTIYELEQAFPGDFPDTQPLKNGEWSVWRSRHSDAE